MGHEDTPNTAPHSVPRPPGFHVINRAGPRPVALETTLLLHGVPRSSSMHLAEDLNNIIRTRGASPALIGVVNGHAIAGLSSSELEMLLNAEHIPKVNTANLGLALFNRTHAATTVSTTMEIATAAGIRLFATGGLGGVHRGYATHLDISADLLALARFPVAVVCSGVKSILDVEATREALETLGIPIIGYRTDRFPAFYQRESVASVDDRCDDAAALAEFIDIELARTGRGIVIANPIPPEWEIGAAEWDEWLTQARAGITAAGITGRNVTPALLARLHEVSNGATLRANIELVRSNAALAADLAVDMGQ